MADDNSFSVLSFGQVFDRSLLVYRRSLFDLLAIGTIVTLPGCLFAAFLLHHSDIHGIWNSVSEEFDFGALSAIFGGIVKEQHTWYVVVVHGLIMSLSTLLLKASVVLLVTKRHYWNERPALGSILQEAASRLPSLLCWTLLCFLGMIMVAVAVTLCFLLLRSVVWALLLGDDPLVKVACHILATAAWIYLSCYLFITFIFCIPALVVERVPATRAFQRAWKLIAGQRLFVFYSLVIHFNLLALTTYVLISTIMAPIGGVVAVFIGLQGAGIVLGPLQVVIVTILYWNARVFVEGCDRATATATSAAAGRDSRTEPLLLQLDDEGDDQTLNMTEHLLDTVESQEQDTIADNGEVSEIV